MICIGKSIEVLPRDALVDFFFSKWSKTWNVLQIPDFDILFSTFRFATCNIKLVSGQEEIWRYPWRSLVLAFRGSGR